MNTKEPDVNAVYGETQMNNAHNLTIAVQTTHRRGWHEYMYRKDEQGNEHIAYNDIYGKSHELQKASPAYPHLLAAFRSDVEFVAWRDAHQDDLP